MYSINYKKLAEKAIDLLMSEYEEKFDDLYERGEVSDNGKNYEDARADWVDEQICKYLPFNRKQLDKFLHGEVESQTEWLLRTASVRLNEIYADDNSFDQEEDLIWHRGWIDGVVDCLGAVMMLEHDKSTTHNPREILRECFDIEE